MRLVLNLFGRLFLKITKGQSGRLALRVLNSQSLEHIHDMRGTIILQIVLIYILDKKRGLKGGSFALFYLGIN